jgi:tight adherence protein C
MISLITEIFKVESLITIFIALAVFGTVVTVAAPMFENDKMKGRMKGVMEERDRLRSAQRAQLNGGDTRLRDKAEAGIYSQIVNALNLRKIFETETTRDTLRQAGLRSERHMITFFAARVAVPIFLAILAFVYTSTVLAYKFETTNSRIVASIVALVFGYYAPNIMLKNLVARRQKSIKRAWSDALDLLLICVESGMALEPAMTRVAKEIGSQSVPLAEEMTLTIAELSYLQDRRKALENLSKRTGLETVKAVVTSLIQSERYGTPLGTALRVLAQENRDARMAEAERKAAALPPKLTVPMILFFLPVIFVVILGPSVIVVMNTKEQ